MILASRGRVEVGIGRHINDSVALREHGPAILYNEQGFAPITDEQVRGIIEEATRVPNRQREKA